MVRLSDDFILACVGTTAGDVNVWILSEESDGQISLPVAPVLTFRAHTMGTNCVSAVVIRGDCNGSKCVLISSGGDDQAISLRLISVSLPESSEVKDVSVEVLASSTKKEACASAIKGINTVGDHSAGYRICTSGYDQRMAMWAILIKNHEIDFEIELEFLSSAPIDIKDINTIGVCVVDRESDGKTKEYLVAGGEGLEVLSFDRSVWQAAQALRKCDNLLITCGAGFSADSGLATYESMPEEYREVR
jgi:hypothetical protein